jgi:hypothetical protein
LNGDNWYKESFKQIKKFIASISIIQSKNLRQVTQLLWQVNESFLGKKYFLRGKLPRAEAFLKT